MAAEQDTATEGGEEQEQAPEPVEVPRNLWERVQRAKRIAAARNRVPKRTWAWIAKREGLNRASCEAIYRDFLSWDVEVEDPLATVDEGIALYTVMLERLGHEAVEADQAAARVGAIRAMNDVLRERFLMLQAAGRLPRNLARYRAEVEFTEIVKEILEAIERRGAGRELVEDIRAIVERRIEHKIGGNVVELRPTGTGG